MGLHQRRHAADTDYQHCWTSADLQNRPAPTGSTIGHMWSRISTKISSNSAHTSKVGTHQFLITSWLAVRNIAQQKTTHEAEILGTELVAVVQIENVLLAHASFDRCRHFYHRARLCHAASYKSSTAVAVMATKLTTNHRLKLQ